MRSNQNSQILSQKSLIKEILKVFELEGEELTIDDLILSCKAKNSKNH